MANGRNRKDGGDRLTTHALKVPGLPCPECNTPIVVDPMVLLSTKSIECASCGLVLTVNVEQSASTLQALGSYMSQFSQVRNQFADKVEGMTGGEAERRGSRSPGRRTRRIR